MKALVCVECSVEFAWDESPSEDRCAQCAAAWAWIRGGDNQPLIRPDWHVTVCPDCGARLEMTTDDPELTALALATHRVGPRCGS